LVIVTLEIDKYKAAAIKQLSNAKYISMKLAALLPLFLSLRSDTKQRKIVSIAIVNGLLQAPLTSRTTNFNSLSPTIGYCNIDFVQK